MANCDLCILQVTLGLNDQNESNYSTKLKAATTEIPFLYPKELQLEISHDQFHNYEINFHLKANGNLETNRGRSYCLPEPELLLVHFQERPPC